jgi:transcriptional regulator GlxA family with amidase domain
MATYPQLSTFTIEELAQEINIWRDQQDREFQEWLARQPPRPATDHS